MSKTSIPTKRRRKFPIEASEETWPTDHSVSKPKTSQTASTRPLNQISSAADVNQVDSFKDLRGKGRDISWNNLTVSLIHKSKGVGCFKKKTDKTSERVVLHKVYGTAKASELIAIMGSSGAGKSTLLNIFTNIDQRGIRKAPESKILVNGEPITPSQMRTISAYVQQVDMFIGSLTVEEQLRYSAQLRMNPKQFPAKAREERVHRLLNQMNLEKCKKTIIGVKGVKKGISIGEKKRLSFACELLTNPDFFFCDEPTSGLDSFMATQVVNVLHKVAKEERKTVITTIHQPSDDVFQLFDKVCFLSREEGVGRVAFLGKPSELTNFLNRIAGPYNEHKRLKGIRKANEETSDEEFELICPQKTGPAEHAMRIISRTISDTDESFEDRVKFIREQFEKTSAGIKQKNRAAQSGEHTNATFNQDLKSKKSYPVSWFVQVRVLFLRSVMTIIRDPVLLQVRLIQIVLTAVVIGLINWQTPITGPTITNFEGILYNCPRDMNFMFLFPSIFVITSEFPIMVRENRAGHYSASAYFVGKSLAELPQYTALSIVYSTIVYWMAGFQRTALKFGVFCYFNMLQSWTAISIAYAGAAVFGSEAVATTYIPMIVLPMLEFGGFYINFETIPIYFKYIAYASWFRYGFEGLQINQWRDLGPIPGCQMTNSTNIYDKYVPKEDNYCPAVDGMGLLARRDMHEYNLLRDGLLLLLILVVARLIGLFALVLRMRTVR
ncbi:ABC transporter ATP-binding protein/permease wht-1 [Aphelenchoides besseyi]|nr:ABC transporter ATP-binding protein/permease wht-1 [Aphelenchoides besseyi]KAI6226627.1 ABC transporter ATP-binding protein/permease wht-1 [Aphelenchoides besseyi]